jgi:hypothetical protein
MNEYEVQSWYMNVMDDSNPLDIVRELMRWYKDTWVLEQDAVGVSVCHVLHKLAIKYRNTTVYRSIIKAVEEVGQNKVVNRNAVFADLVAYIVRHIQQKKK